MARIIVREKLAKAKKIGYFPAALDFIEMYEFPKELIEAVVRHPTDISLDPRAHEVDYAIVRVRRGDITLSVSFKENWDTPYVMFIHLNTPEEHTRASGARSGGSGQSKTPKTPTELQGWFRRAGCTLSNGAGGVKVFYQGIFVGTIHLTTHSHGGAHKSSFSQLVRALRRAQGQAAARSIEETQ